MQHPTQKDELTSLLGELETLLDRETTALKALDRETIESLANDKLALFAKLQTLTEKTRPDPRHRTLLEQVRRPALNNQLLLVHARDAVRGTLAMLAGEAPGTRQSYSPPAGEGMRVSVRG